MLFPRLKSVFANLWPAVCLETRPNINVVVAVELPKLNAAFRPKWNPYARNAYALLWQNGVTKDDPVRNVLFVSKSDLVK